jgi:hypothetical protein
MTQVDNAHTQKLKATFVRMTFATSGRWLVVGGFLIFKSNYE